MKGCGLETFNENKLKSCHHRADDSVWIVSWCEKGLLVMSHNFFLFDDSNLNAFYWCYFSLHPRRRVRIPTGTYHALLRVHKIADKSLRAHIFKLRCVFTIIHIFLNKSLDFGKFPSKWKNTLFYEYIQNTIVTKSELKRFLKSQLALLHTDYVRARRSQRSLNYLHNSIRQSHIVTQGIVNLTSRNYF